MFRLQCLSQGMAIQYKNMALNTKTLDYQTETTQILASSLALRLRLRFQTRRHFQIALPSIFSFGSAFSFVVTIDLRLRLRFQLRRHLSVLKPCFVLYCHALRKTAVLQSKRRQFEELLLNFTLELKKLRDENYSSLKYSLGVQKE